MRFFDKLPETQTWKTENQEEPITGEVRAEEFRLRERERDRLKMRLLVTMQRKGTKRMHRFSSIVTQRQGRMRKGAWRFVDLLGPHPLLSEFQ
nr:hypothetical protein Iba_chr01dCG16860 [Ipomoea batatas]